MSTTTDHRKAAEERVAALAALLEAQPESAERDALLRECKALVIAIDAFHMEGIRFRMFNVDRILTRGTLNVPADAATAFAEARKHLEAAGFHTRSH
jgi:hypothetical protein